MASQLFYANVEDIDCPTYEALLYCWGDPREGKRYIEMNGAPFAATGNLHAALVQLTDVPNGRPQMLCVDAICINQSSDAIEERDAQVSITLHIYAQSQHVVIWLGEADPNTETAFNSIRKPVRHTQQQRGSLDSFGMCNSAEGLFYAESSLTKSIGSMSLSYVGEGHITAFFDLVTTRP